MSTHKTGSLGGFALCVLTALVTFGSGSEVARAADTEAFKPQDTADTRPNVLFLIDSTESLATGVGGDSGNPIYDPGYDYSSLLPAQQACSTETAYFDTSPSAALPDCTKQTIGAVPVSSMRCESSDLEFLKAEGSLDTRKWVTKKVAGNKVSWPGLTMSYKKPDGDAYCDDGSSGAPDSAFATLSPLKLYYGNFLNFERALALKIPVPGGAGGKSRMEFLKDALEKVAEDYQDKINIGMMRTSTTGARQTGGAGKGGMVTFPIQPMDAAAKFGALHGGSSALDDFIWTMRRRVACKNDQNCDAFDPKPNVDTCGPGKDCIGVMYPNGSSKPLAEMLYEAYLYFSGQTVQYGSRSAVDPTIEFDSVDGSINDPSATGSNRIYKKPATTNCQNNYIIMLTDGLSAQDSSSNTDIKKLVESLPESVLTAGGYTVSRNGSVTYPINSWSSNAKAPSEYIDDLAFYLRWARPDYAPLLPATGVTTYTVGFDLASLSEQDAADATQLLNDIAKQGGTEAAVIANSSDAVSGLLDGIVNKILATSTSFSAPSVTINAFNRTQNLNDLYMAVFRPEYLRRWKGNVKKYRVVVDEETLTSSIVDRSGSPAIDDLTGNFLPQSESRWSASGYDGAFAPEGGAASQLPDPDNRTVYIDSEDSSLESLSGYVAGLSTNDKRTLFDFGNLLPDSDVDSRAEDLVEWIYGVDLYDEAPIGGDPDRDGLFNDGDGDRSAQKSLMGDPLHSRPAVVVYGRGNDEDDAVVFITTNEGLLHAIDARDAEDGTGGQELWSFAPRELMYRMDWLRDRATKDEDLGGRTDPRFYGIDGTVRILRIDRDRDGPIDSSKGDRVFIYFGLRRGGTAYYGMDVTNPDSPKLMWRTELADEAQSWSNPTVGDWVRVNIKGASYGKYGEADPSDPSGFDAATVFDNADAKNRFVVVIGGGFDPSNDATTFAQDTKGNKLYMLDAVSGEVLWSAGPSGSDANLKLSKMTNSIVADVRVVDLSGDLYADRMYAADLGGQVWRFDIANGNEASNLVEGGVMASVGGEASASKDRRFYYAPDISEVRCGGRVFYNVAIGSGDREKPVSDVSTRNSFFSFRDHLTRIPVNSADYKDDCSGVTDRPCFETIYDDSELVDVTTTASPTVGPDKAGWKMDLVAVNASASPPTISSRGEKALAESRTFANNVYFTTYAPELRKQGDCGNEVGVNRLYVVNACSAAPVNNYDGEVGTVSVEDRSLTLAQGSIAPEVVFIFPTTPPGCTTQECMPLPQCLIGLESCGNGMPNRPVRVFWRERGAE